MENMELLKAMREMMERQIGSLASKIDANQAKAEADMKAEREETKANQARMEVSLKGEMRLTASAIEKRMEAIVHSIRSERDGKIQRRSVTSWSGKRSLRKGSQWQVWNA
jgi:multidrug resistance efflux pump